MSKNLFQKVWDAHTVATLPNGNTQLFIGLHLIHEVTSPQAFAMLKEKGIKVAHPERTFATVDHIVPTRRSQRVRPLQDNLAEDMLVALKANCEEHGITFYGENNPHQGIVHIIGPELGLTQPGVTVVCGDSHTSTHGAFGAVAFGIGTSQVRDVLATQTMDLEPLKVRRVEVNGPLQPGVYAKDVILHIIKVLGVNGGTGYAYEYAGTTFDNMSIEERMTVCNMSIEGGARCGYVNPDEKTFAYLKGRDYSPKGENWDKAVAYWKSLASGPDAEYDDVVTFDAAEIRPSVTWGINPGQGQFIDSNVPEENEIPENERGTWKEALEYMQLKPGQPMEGIPVDVCFIGSCTNSRISDLREVAKFVEGKKVNERVQALIVPGSWTVAKQAEEEGLKEIFEAAGFEWREPGCSMCLAMNPDKLVGTQLCASSSNRNFKGRQGSSRGRTILMSPVMVAAAAIAGELVDAREVFAIQGASA